MMDKAKVGMVLTMIGLLVMLAAIGFAAIKYEDHNSAVKDKFWSETDSRVSYADAFWDDLQAQRGLFQAIAVFGLGVVLVLGGFLVRLG